MRRFDSSLNDIFVVLDLLKECKKSGATKKEFLKILLSNAELECENKISTYKIDIVDLKLKHSYCK